MTHDMHDETPYFDEDAPTARNPGSRNTLVAVALMLPIASVVSLVVGLGLGSAIGWFAKPESKLVELEPTYDVTDIKFQAACLPMVAEKATRIEELNATVSDLRADLAVKQARVAELEAASTKGKGKTGGGASSVDLSRAREELAQVKLQLASALQEKDQLVAELTATKGQLEVAESTLYQTQEAYTAQVQDTEVAREDASMNKYARFLGESQLSICEKGGRKKMGDCRGTVTSLLSTQAVKDQFFQCVRSGQAIPVVREMDGNGSLPSYSSYLDQGSKVTRGYYVTMCDPSLPEARTAHAPPPSYTPMSALSAAASYLSNVVPSSISAPTAAMLPAAFAPDPVDAPVAFDDPPQALPTWDTPPPPVQTASMLPPPPPVEAPVPPPAPPPAAVASNDQYRDVLDISDILGPDDPALAAAPTPPPAPPVHAADKDAAPEHVYTQALDADLSDLPDGL